MKLGQILSKWKVFLELDKLMLKQLKLIFDLLEDLNPFFFHQVVFVKAGSDLSLILPVMRCNLRLSFLVNLNFKSSLTRPLFSKIFIQFFDAEILKVFALFSGFTIISTLFADQPVANGL